MKVKRNLFIDMLTKTSIDQIVHLAKHERIIGHDYSVFFSQVKMLFILIFRIAKSKSGPTCKPSLDSRLSKFQ